MSSAAGAWAALSKWGLGAALIYAGAALYLVHDDYTHAGGGWISLQGMTTGLAVAPVSWLADKFNLPFRPLNPFHAGAALLVCAGLVYTIVAGIEHFIRGIRAT